MPVYGHAERLLKPYWAESSSDRGDLGIDLFQETIVEANFHMASHLMAHIGAHKPGVEIGRSCASGSQAGVECVAAIRRTRPESRELMMERPTDRIAFRAQ